MKKHELLKYAYDNYPKGTKVHFHGHQFPFTLNGNYSFDDEGDIVDGAKRVVYLLDKNKWAEIVTDREPLVKTNDGIFLFEGDYVACVFLTDGKWELGKEYNWILSNTVTQSCQDQCSDTRALFSTKQAALDWIEKINKPKDIDVALHGNDGVFAKVTKDLIRFKDKQDNWNVISLKPSDIEDIYHALKTLNNEN